MLRRNHVQYQSKDTLNQTFIAISAERLAVKFFYEDKGQTVRVENGYNLAYGAHIHSHFELVYMLDGQSRIVIDGKDCLLGPDEILLIFPNQIHQFKRVGSEKYILAIFPQEMCQDYRSIYKHKIPVSPVVSAAHTMPLILPALQQMLNLPALPLEISQPLLKGFFLIIVGELLQRMVLQDTRDMSSDTIRLLLNYCQDNYRQDISLDTIAEALFISKFYISRLFSEKLGMTYTDYIANLRISEACRLLDQSDAGVTEIAFAVGYDTVRSFNRAFRKNLGTAPREYRRLQRISWHETRPEPLPAHAHASASVSASAATRPTEP